MFFYQLKCLFLFLIFHSVFKSKSLPEKNTSSCNFFQMFLEWRVFRIFDPFIKHCEMNVKVYIYKTAFEEI